MDSLLLQKEEIPTSSELPHNIPNFMTYLDNSPLESHAMKFIIGIISLFTCLYLILLIIYTPATRLQNDLRDELFAARAPIGNSQLNNRNLLHPDTLDMSLNDNFDLWRSSDENADVLSSSSARTANTFSSDHTNTFSSDYTSSEDSVLSSSDELWDYTPPHTPVDNFTSSSFHYDSSSLEDWPRVHVQDIRPTNVRLPSYEEAIPQIVEDEHEYRLSRSCTSCDEPPLYEEATRVHDSIVQLHVFQCSSDQQQS